MNEHTCRLSADETVDLINRIPCLKDFFKERFRSDGSDTANGIMYLSRFNKEAFNDQAVKEKKSHAEDAEDVSASDVKETQKEKTTIVSFQNKREKRRLAMSIATLAARPDKRESLVRDGAIPVLSYMSMISDKSIQRSCSSAFSFLSTQANLRAQMIEEGSFAALIMLSNNSNKQIASECCRALCNLCCESGYEHRAVKDGITFAILHAITVCPDIVDVCLKILLNLSCVSDRYTRLEDVNETLMHFNNYALSTENEILVISAVCNLSALRNFQLRLVEDGCLKFVERVMKSSNLTLRKIASDVVDNLTTEGKTRVKLVDNGIISTLLMMSRDELEAVRMSAVKAFYNLARDVTCREKIVNANAMSVIIKMSMEKFENVAMGRTASKILRILCGDSRTAHKLVRDGIIKALMALLRTDDGVIQQYCAESICSLFQISDVMGRLVEQGAVGILVALSQNTNDHITSEWCAFALYHLATSNICPESMLEPAILPCIIKLCEVASEKTRYFCSAALAHVTQIKTVNSSESIPILVHLLRTVSENSATKTLCAVSLYNMADKDENCYLMLEAGALQPVVRLTQSDHVQTKMKCAAILSRLSLHKDYYDQFAVGDVLRVLLDLSSVDHLFTQRKVIIALSNLSQSKQLRGQLLELNPIPYITSLASKCDENCRRGCASIVCNLSYENGSERAIVEAGIVPTLLIIAMITSDQLISKVICVKAIGNLMADKSLFAGMVKDGIIWGLSSLAAYEDEEMRLLCTKALCCLSCDFYREMLSVPACVRTVLRAVGQSENLELLRAGARALTNLLMKTKDSDESFRSLAVVSMTPMGQCEDVEVREMCILCLCLASQSVSCRESIVKSGMLQKIDPNTIFLNPRVSYAYLTMFENIANNPLMRTELLDDKCINRFMQICALGDPVLDIAVGRAIYCISCAEENIRALVEQNIMALIHGMLNAKYVREFVLAELIVHCLYNLTTAPEVHGKLVSQDAVAAVVQLWEEAKEDQRMCSLAIAAIAHLACGNVNTDRMVSQGCSELLCFIFNARTSPNPKHQSYKFAIQLQDCVAVAFRNLLSVVSNQPIMVNNGCLEVVMAMAIESMTIIQEASTGESQHSSSTYHHYHPGTPHLRSSVGTLSITKGTGYVHPERHSISKNCAAALRLLTYNPALREKLVASGCLNVILEGEAEDISIAHNLLAALETESWYNGSRGPQKESRILGRKPASINIDLLGGTRILDLNNVEMRKVQVEKFYVTVQVEEPVADLEQSFTSLEHSIEDLASYEESDENDNPRSMSCPKHEVEIITDINALKDGDAPLDDLDSPPSPPPPPPQSSTVFPNPTHGQEAERISRLQSDSSAHSVRSSSFDDDLGSPGTQASRFDHAQSNKVDRTAGNSILPDISVSRANTNEMTAADKLKMSFNDESNEQYLPRSFSVKRGETQPTQTKPLDPIDPSHLVAASTKKTQSTRFPGINSMKASPLPSPPIHRIRKPKNNDAKFKNVLAFIKASKASKGARIDEVIDKWSEMSRF